MMNKKYVVLVICLISILIFLIMFVIKDSNNNIFDNNSNDSDIEIITESTQLNIEYEEDELSGSYDKITTKITLNNDEVEIDGSGASYKNKIITISQAGVYYFTGILEDGTIQIDADKNDDVQLVLDNCMISSSNSAPINGIKCNKLIITVINENTITDSSNYTLFTDDEKTEPAGTLFTKTDLVINGTGTLNINSNYQDGVVSKDTLKIINCTLNINSADDGIRGKDYVVMKDANITIKSTGDGIKSNNDEDTSLGYIAIQGGNITINTEADGIQAETILNISDNSNINITTTGQIVSSSNNMNQMPGKDRNTSSWSSNNSDTSNDTSSKGLKAGTEITIESGNIIISSTDDSIHSNGYIIIDGGEITLSSEDDGIHADTDIVINNGSIKISKSYEGIESNYVEINGGTIDLIASDDGINISGGSDSSSINGRPGQNNFNNTTSSNTKLVINDGNITVNSTGDGLDSNGSIYIYGGTIVVKGPTSDGDAPIDYDGECVISGGNLIAYGSSGMSELPASTSTQNSLVFYVSGSSNANLILKNSSGNEITSIKTEKTYSMVIISNDNIKKDETYTLYQNETSIGSITVNSTVNSNGNSSNKGRMMNNRR